MPRVTIKTGFVRDDGSEVVLEEYLCDWQGCPNVAEHILDVPVEFRAMVIVCSKHMATLHGRGPDAD